MTTDVPNSSFSFAFAPNLLGSFLTKADDEGGNLSYRSCAVMRWS